MYRRVLLGASAVIVADCAGSGGTIAEPQTTVAPVTDTSATVVDDPDFVKTESGDVAEPGVSTTEFNLGAQPSAPEIPVVPETGVPGIDSADAFCRAWSEFAGSFLADGLLDVDVRGDIAAAWITQLSEIVEDLSLITDVQIPLTEAYLTANCPDQASSQVTTSSSAIE